MTTGKNAECYVGAHLFNHGMTGHGVKPMQTALAPRANNENTEPTDSYIISA